MSENRDGDNVIWCLIFRTLGKDVVRGSSFGLASEGH